MTVFLNDPDLLERFRSGDRKALSTVYRFYAQCVGSYVRRRLLLAGSSAAGGLPALAADLVQDVFVRAFTESARLAYDGLRDYGPLLLAIARNAVIDYLRRRVEEQLDSRHLERLIDHEMSVQVDDAPWTDPQTMVFVERYLAALPQREHAVYVQRYAQGRSQMQAADALGLTRQQVRTLEERLRAGLARELARAKLATARDMHLR